MSLLSFIWPGLGHAYLGERHRAIVFAAPPAVVVAILLVGAAQGLERFAIRLIDPSLTVVVLGVILGLAAWRIAAIVDAFRSAGTEAARHRPLVLVTVGLLIMLVLAPHGLATYYASSVYAASARIFDASSEPAVTPGIPSPDASGAARMSPSSSVSPSTTGNEQDFAATPAPTPAAADARINVLLTGIDSGHDREHALTDTLMVVSVDPKTGSMAMISFPRDISGFKLYNGGRYRDRINSLMSYARNHPKQFPDGAVGTLTKELGYLLGIPIHYYAAINLEGFERLINLVGGVDVDNPKPINDPLYDWFDGTYGFKLSAGMHHLNGKKALAYARSRQGVGDSDFTRAKRQQQIIVALREKLTKPETLTRIPELLDAVSRMVKTNFPVAEAADFVDVAKDIRPDAIKRYVLGPPYSVHPPTESTGGRYVLRLDMERLKQLSIKLFGSDSAYFVAP